MNGNVLGYAIGGLIAAEAVGLTDFSGGGTESRVSPTFPQLPQSPVMSPPETGSGLSATDLQAILSARDSGRDVQSAVDRAVSRVSQQRPQGQTGPTIVTPGETGPSTDEVRRIIEDTVNTTTDAVEETTDTVGETAGTEPPWWSDPSEWQDRLNLNADSGTGGGDETPRPTDDGARGSQPDRSDLVSNLTDPAAGAQTGDVLAGGFEAAGGAEDIVGGGVETLQRTGKTLSETTKAVTGREYETGGTFAERTEGTGRRRLYEGSVSGMAAEEVGKNVRSTAEGMQEAVNKAFEGLL